jgi:MFS family permease
MDFSLYGLWLRPEATGLFSDYRGIPWQAKLLIYINFVPSIAVGFIYTDLSYFLPKVQGLASPWPGLTITVMGLTLVAESIPMGVAADKYGRRKMLILGNVCASLSLIGFALTNNVLLILVVAVLEGTGEAASAVSVVALLAEKAGDEKRTTAFSGLALFGWVAIALGGFVIPSVGGFQSLGLDIREAHIYLYVIVGLVSLSVTPLMLKITEGERIPQWRGFLPKKSRRVIGRFLIYSVTIAVGAGLFVPLMAYWFSAAYGVSDVVSGSVLGATNLLTAGVVFLSPMLAKRLGLVRATVLTQASSTVFMLLVPLSPTFSVSASIYLVRVFLMNLSNPLTQSLIMGLVSPDERGKASGINAALWRLPNSLSTSAGYVLIQDGLLGLPFYIATVLYVAGITMFWFLFKDARLPEEIVAQPPSQSSSFDGPEEVR